jgi:hypothetical protein
LWLSRQQLCLACASSNSTSCTCLACCCLLTTHTCTSLLSLYVGLIACICHLSLPLRSAY